MQYWDREMDPTNDKIDVLELDGPVCGALHNYENNQDDIDQVHHDVNFEIDQNFYNPEDDESECLLGASHDELENDLNDSFGDRQFGSYDEVNIKLKAPILLNKSKTNLELENSNLLKMRKRDLKRTNKRAIYSSFSKNLNCSLSANMKNVSSKACDNKSGLIIKICSGSNIIIKENTIMAGRLEASGFSKPNKTLDCKYTGQEIACSTSTLSNDRQEGRRMSQASFSSIELENNVKIICRSIGPLKAEERKQKVLHYLEKKRTRKWNKRINYA